MRVPIEPSNTTLFTFCVDIGKFPVSTLVSVANAWISGLVSSGTTIRRIVLYTNLEIRLLREVPGLEVRRFEAGLSVVEGENIWQRLTTLKFFYYRLLLEEFGENPIWSDLDTFVANDISYLGDIGSFCVMLGSEDQRAMRLHTTNPDFTVSRNRMINGSVFNVDEKFLEAVDDVVSKNRGLLALADQDAFNIVFHFLGLEIPVLGVDMYEDHVYSFDAWNTKEAVHIDQFNSSVLFRDAAGVMRSRLHPEKKLDLIQFTFRKAQLFLEIDEPRENWFLGYWRQCAQHSFLTVLGTKPFLLQ